METNPPKKRKLESSAEQLGAPEGLQSTLGLASSASGIFRPNSFMLETAELLKEVRLDYKGAFPGVDGLLHQVKGAVEGMEPHDPSPISEASSQFTERHQIAIPYPEPRPDENSPYKVSIATPTQCNVVGSYVSRTMAKSTRGQGIDMVVKMPRSMFQDKDYLNFRYFYKRAYFLANVAVAVRRLSAPLDISFEYMNDNPLLPVIAVRAQRLDAGGTSIGEPATPAKEHHLKHSGYRICIIPVAPELLFPLQKLVPSKNCLRCEVPDDKKANLPTAPFYNSTLKAEGMFLSYLRVLRLAEKNCAAFKDVCILGRVWLEQRGFGGGISRGGFGHFEWAVLVALLLQPGGRKAATTLSPSLTSLQIFKGVIRFLAAAEVEDKPRVLGVLKGGTDAVREPGPVLFDATRQLNLAHKMTLGSAWLLSQHARWTQDMLRLESVDHFASTFITKADLSLHVFDLVVRVRCDDASSLDRRGLSAGFGEGLFPLLDFSNILFGVLKKALGDRAKLIHTRLPQGKHWDLSGPARKLAPSILVGVVFDPTNMARKVDHGPSGEDEGEAREFRRFWGSRSELRQFADGRIVETLIWTQDSSFAICEEITRYILQRDGRLRLQGEDLEFIGRRFDSLLPSIAQADARFSAARQAFEVLERDIRSLPDIPLHVRQLAPTAPELRSASVQLPDPGSAMAALCPMDVAMSFEASGRWPDNLAAIQRAKVAFLLKIGSSLEESKAGISTHLGMEDSQVGIQNLAFLDVLYEGGFAFRLRIHSDLEETLLERTVKDKTIEQHARRESVNLLATFRRLYGHLPAQNQTILTFCTRFTALSAAIRLAKYWFNVHKLSHHFNEEFIELVVLHVFLQPCPWQTPSSVMTGFLRTLLFLSRWGWRVEPLIVDSAGDLSANDRSAISTRLEAWRNNIDPNMNHTVLFVATSHDASGTAYTVVAGEPAPSKVVASRMTMLARAACKLVREKGVDLDPRALFVPSLKEYDVLIHLSPSRVADVLHGDDGSKRSAFKNLDARTGRSVVPVPRHPATTLLGQLKSAFAASVAFFYGAEDDSVIAAVWNPQVHRRSFRVNLPCSFRPVGGEGEFDGDKDLVEVDREAILAEMARIGGDLIVKVEVVGVPE